MMKIKVELLEIISFCIFPEIRNNSFSSRIHFLKVLECKFFLKIWKLSSKLVFSGSKMKESLSNQFIIFTNS